MSRNDKKYLREIREGLGRFPTWPIQRNLNLGMIGYYHGRYAAFEWKTDLESIGVVVPSIHPQAVLSELYCTMDSVEIDFSGENELSRAHFQFFRKRAVATQGYEMSYREMPLDALLSQLKSAIRSQKLTWDKDWVILTELWESTAFTALIAGSNNSSTEISTDGLVSGAAFNVANPVLNLRIGRSSRMSYQAVAQTGVKPFFNVHKLIFDTKRGYYLKSYGENR